MPDHCKEFWLRTDMCPNSLLGLKYVAALFGRLLKNISPVMIRLYSTGTVPLNVMPDCFRVPLSTFACAPPNGKAQPEHEVFEIVELATVFVFANIMKSVKSFRSSEKPLPGSAAVF
ncbi:hypothetical protein D3C85_1122980 [compost metagenome]